MKTFLLILFLEIKSAIFYPTSVSVVDEREFKVKKGLNNLEIILNPFVLETSIKVRSKGGEIVSIDIKREKFEKPIQPLKGLQDSLDKLFSYKNIYENEKRGVENALEFLKSFRVAYAEKLGKEYIEKPFDSQKLSQTINYIIKENKNLGKNVIEIEKKINELNKEIEILKNKINELEPIGKEGIKITLSLDAFSESAKIILEYIIKERCGWNPFYELTAIPEKGEVKIKGWAKVYQFSGEDFKNTKIALSTGMPHTRASPPEITIWEIFPVIPKVAFLSLEGRKAEEKAPQPESLPLAERKEEFLTLHYEIPGVMDIPSRKEGIPILYVEQNLPAKFSYYTYPRLDKKVYFKGNIFNKSDNLFVAGEANLYVEEEFRGKEYLQSFIPDDSLEIYFGEDPQVKVDRKKKIHEVYKKGVIKKEIVHHLEYETMIKNFRKKEIELILIEQVPISTQPYIRIENIKFSHKPFEIEEATGIYKFKINLKPEEKFTLNFEFDIISEKEDIFIRLF